MKKDDPNKDKEECNILCSHNNCKVKFSKNYYSSGFKTKHPIKDDYKFHQILEGILKTRMFCMRCSQKHATIVCMNAKIPIIE